MNGPTCGVCGESGGRPVLLKGALTVVRCPGCSLAFLWPPPTREHLRDIYDHYYSQENADLHPITADRYAEILSAMEHSQGPGRILDVGCGAGQFLEVATRRGWQAEGTEISGAARPFLERRHVRLHAVDLPALVIPYRYDAITLFEVLEHVEAPLAYLETSIRLLRPGGWLYLTTPNFDGLSRRLRGAKWRVVATEHLSYFSPASLRRALGRAGFTGVSVTTRNLDIADLRLRRVGGRVIGSEPAAGRETSLRETVEASPWLRRLKALANAALRGGGLGDSLVAWARRPS
jgi:SAM-dependent methyltransferase